MAMLPPKVNTDDEMIAAIKQRNIQKAQGLSSIRDKTKFVFVDWSKHCNNVGKFDDKIRKEQFFTVLFQLAENELRPFLSTTLHDENGEWLALLILERRPQLLKADYNSQTPLDLAVQSGKAEVVRMIIQREDGQVPAGLLEKAAGSGHLPVVKMLVDFDTQSLDHGYPLQKAVCGRHKAVVEYLLEKRGDLVEKIRPHSSSVLFDGRIFSEGHETANKEIDRLLVNTIMKGKNRSPALVKKLLKGPQDQHKEISLDFSIFSQESHRFKSFVEKLVQEDQGFKLRFHATLLYVAFPSLNATHSSDELLRIGQEVVTLLQWLKEEKKVTEVLRLRVPGSSPRAESEEFVARALDGISVQELDWRVLDLSIDILIECDAKSVEMLHLYNSGNWGVLQQWSGSEGVVRLSCLKELEITIIEGMISEDRAKDYIKHFQRRLNDTMMQTGRDKITVHLVVSPWKSSESSSKSGMDLRALQENTLTITKLKKFLDFYRDCQGNRSPMTNVAIIDNGIDGTLPILRGRITDGLSLVEDNHGFESAWWLPSHPHGTHMASFIHKLDPCCGLYIIKVCEGVSGIDADILADAIDEAVEKKVDIISMSHASKSYSDRLRQAILNARRHDIVMLSSQGDRGGNQEKVWPADDEGVMSISSYTNLGKPAESTESNAQYFFQGENVKISTEPGYLKLEETASGSSVATALAAGVAALTLSCRMLANKEGQINRTETVKKVFRQMIGDDNDKYVKPWNFYKDKHYEKQEGMEWLQANFGDRAR